MKLALRGFVGLLGLALVWYAVQMVAAESGEVVVLTTTNAEGSPQETRLWVVDHDGRAWLRSGSDIQSWYGNLQRVPTVEVLRAETRGSYTAVPVVAKRDSINRLMAEKYAWADGYIGFFFPRDNAIPIRLDPAPVP